MTALRNLSVLVYAHTATVDAAARGLVQDPRMSKCRVEIRTGTITDAAAWLSDHPSPDVLIVGDAADQGLHQRLDGLASAVEPGCKVVVVGEHDSISLYRQLLSQGVADYLGGPVTARDLHDSLCRLFHGENQIPPGRLILCLGASGGAGASTVATLMAGHTAERIGDAILLDLDLGMGSCGLLMAQEIRESIASALANSSLDAAMLERCMSSDQGLRVLSTGGNVRESKLWNDDAIDHLVGVARTLAKAVIVDLPKGWSQAHERLLIAADEAILVAVPDLASLRNARMIVDYAATRAADRMVRVIINKVGMAKGREYGTRDFKQALGVEPVAFVPWDPEPFLTAIANGRPITSATGKAIKALATAADRVLPARSARTAKMRADFSLKNLKSLLMMRPA